MSDNPIQDDIEEARAARERAARAIEEARRTKKRDLEPLWRRIQSRRIHNSFGEELELSYRPKGARA